MVALPDGEIKLAAGDVLTIPITMKRSFSNPGATVAEAFVVRGGDHPRPPTVFS